MGKQCKIRGNKIYSGSPHDRSKGFNRLEVGKSTKIVNSDIFIGGDSSQLIIGGNCLIRNATIHIDESSNVIIGNHFDSGANLRLISLEGKSITFGDDCMLSTNIEVRTSDDHSILNEDGKRINPAKDTTIGNHVWIGANAVLLKGSIIEDDVIIGNSAVVGSGVHERGSIYVGVPAKKLRSGITWIVERISPDGSADEKNRRII